ncbi:MAG TPA: FtsQ-type POTRA domain-containing protein [Hyphomicrobiaceae bacterium]|nr:FtsQ-type POTRA domain-containing protein [Hyphomicrobiaceae bacterium]
MIALGIVAPLAFASMARPLTSPAPALAEIEQLIELAGFGLTQVSVTGHRYTLDSDIFDAIDLENAHTMLAFDTRAAQDRIERLPWVERASIERVLPDRLEVRVFERSPSAVWRRNGRTFLIDATGRVLAAVPPDAMLSLPRVAGEGAAAKAAGLNALLAEHPQAMARVEVAERVGQRRWVLRLTDGGSVQLPANGEPEGIARWLRIEEARGPGVVEIDVRVKERTLVRAPEGSKAALELAARQVAGGP